MEQLPNSNDTRTEAKQVHSAMGATKKTAHMPVVLGCLAALSAMGALTYASVPLYRLFCQVTGYAGTTQRAEKMPDQVFERTMTVRFDANVRRGLSWKFEPVQRKIDVKVGESALAFYRATNTSDQPITGTASFNVSPDGAGLYFSKVECFCFTEQTLAAGESVEMPVSFFIDPAIMKDRDADIIQDITLSYTFYPVEDETTDKQAAKPAKAAMTPRG